MARALVAFYPLAGRLGVSDDDGRMEISCNGDGALFVVAQADELTADDVKELKPSPELRRLFVPLTDEPSSPIMLAVQVVESSFVTPSEPAPRKGLWLSSLDLWLASQGHTPTISCNGEGALFVVAHADDLGVDDVKKFKPSPELRRLFVPRIEPSSIILAIQVTFLKCGGVALGTALHHVAIDASSAFHFFQTWSAFSKHGDRAVVELPCHDRTLLRARSPPTVHPDALLTLHPKLILSDPEGPLAFEVFTISRDQVTSLKKNLCGGTASTFCALSALIWQCTCVARRLPPDSEVRIVFPADLRRRMRPPLPSHYFGNAVFRLCVTGAAGDIAMEALGCVATRIKSAIERMDDELVRSAIDYFEMAEMDKRPTLRGTLPPTDLHITSWFGRPQYDADFGWGKPQFMSRAESVRGGYVYLMNDEGPEDDGGGSGDVRVLVCMEAVNIKELGRLLYAKL